jgi:beta-galactosidase
MNQFISTQGPLCYRIDGASFYLNSGEFHYFRVPKQDWRTRMRLFKEAGGNCLATYIPWLLHEPEEGRFCFGETSDILDLEGFLRVAKEEGLVVIARPGPYQYSELIYDGLPGWLCEGYPELRARNYSGEPFRVSSISYTHPLFLEKTRRWFDAVLPILRKYTIREGGPVAFVQIDNELVGIHEWFGTLDYHPVTMGFHQPDGAYPAFLAHRYGAVAALNQLYGSAYENFIQVDPPDPALSETVEMIRRRRDYFEFYLSTVADYARTLAGMLRTHGIDTPIVHNSANPGMNAYFLEIAEAVGEHFVLGSDHYYSLDQTWPQNNPTPQYALRAMVSLEMLRLMGYPPSVFELPGGSLSDWPPITAQDALAAYMTNLAFGMKGHNYYVFTGGPNPPGAGSTTDLYDYGAGIGPFGEVRPLYEAQKQFGQFIASRPWLVEGRRMTDLRVGVDFEQPRAVHFWTQAVEGLPSPGEAWDLLRKGPLTTALCTGLSPQLVDLAKDDWVDDPATPLMVVCSIGMAAEKQQRLVRYLNGGGKLLLTPVVPMVDEVLRPCTILADALGGVRSKAYPRETRLVIGEIENVHGKMFPLENIPERAQILGRDERSGKVAAALIGTEGGGSALLLGVSWTHMKREHERMLRFVMSCLDLRQVLSCSNPNIWAALWSHGDRAWVYLINLFSSAMEVEVQFSIRGQEISTGLRQVAPFTVDVYEVPGLA